MWPLRSASSILRHRLGTEAPIEAVEYDAPVLIGEVRVSLHSAGHIFGSSQIRIEAAGEIWVVTGDFKRAPDPTCAAFTPIECDVLVSEATFAFPCYRWPDTSIVIADIFRWWESNRAHGRASVLFCYALGKAQRVLAELTHHTDRAVYAHGAVLPLIQAYRDVQMLPTLAIERTGKVDYAGALVIAPPSASGSPWMRRFGDASTGFCSGWMQVRGARRRRGYDRGFVLSDHADWPGLLATIADSRASGVADARL